ncbi:holin, Cph1 family [Peptoniphilus asaccharolyticus DSM 20463]|uniref:Holin, Cph1 family n=1 Tax=Peptoniphilus asaccharolyticus DSM 20463 TaxID=573058 RepID=A0A1W1UCN6_PEPAS|nr:phage holin family protein [Peptoniphilus asaccharolyticus]MBL7576458.1 phage holin family protein [Peptoniphilus asaccharolyticus]SMB78820.1 holin, Cph1 family [Peptoniphilus asaccharolyticus DSM 20463]
MYYSFSEILKIVIQLKNNIFIHILFLIVIFDVLTGIAKSILNKKIKSSVGIKGLITHIIVIILIITIWIYLTILDYESIALYLNIFFILFYCISLIENLSELGIPIPRTIFEYVKIWFEKLK